MLRAILALEACTMQAVTPFPNDGQTMLTGYWIRLRTDNMKAEFDTIEQASAFVQPLIDEKKYVISAVKTKEGKIIVSWEEQKKYTAQDGKEYTDEVWMTEDGRMIQIQDLEPEHAKNIIRMMLRQEREARASLEEYMASMVERLTDPTDEANVEPPGLGTDDPNTPRTLH